MLNAKRGWPVGQGSLRVLSSILNGIHSHGLWKGPSSMSFQKELEGSFIQGENDWVVAGLQSSADDKGKVSSSKKGLVWYGLTDCLDTNKVISGLRAGQPFKQGTGMGNGNQDKRPFCQDTKEEWRRCTSQDRLLSLSLQGFKFPSIFIFNPHDFIYHLYVDSLQMS